MSSNDKIKVVLEFWFETLSPKQWWSKDAELDHQIRDRFGRYPHRNQILGRPSTPEEIEFLQQPGTSF